MLEISVSRKAGSRRLVGASILIAVGMTSAASASALPRNPNSLKYREASPAAATGRSGSASLSSRSLIGQDGLTTLEITTADLDSAATPPGNIAKAQVKSFDGEGEVVFAQNYTGLVGGGSFTRTYSQFVRGQSLQVQANVRGIDGQRTDVVTVTHVVRRRPDLEAAELQAPTQALLGSIVNISAVVRELNSDTGARANCLLSVDGAIVDRADGIWVDAGDTVTCAFSHVFESLGTKQLQVRLANVTPGDWDAANHEKTATIQIVEASQPFNSATGNFYDYDSRWDYRVTGSYQRADGTYPATTDWGYGSAGRERYQGASAWAYVAGAVTVPSATIDFAFTRDGSAILPRRDIAVTVHSTHSGQGDGWSWTSACGSGEDAPSNAHRVYGQVCSLRQTGPDGQVYGQTDVYAQTYSGQVTYFSWQSGQRWSGDSWAGTWSYNYGHGPVVLGDPVIVGTSYSVTIGVSDGQSTYRTTIPMSPSSLDYFQDPPQQCYASIWYWGYSVNQNVCVEKNFYEREGVHGGASF